MHKHCQSRCGIASMLVSHGQTAFFSLSLGREKKGSGPVLIPQLSGHVKKLRHNNVSCGLKIG